MAALTFPPRVSQATSPPSLPAFVVDCVLDDNHFDWSVILICVSFIAKGVEHFFMCLLAICSSSFENSVQLIAHLLIYRIVFILVYNFWCSLHILDLNPLSDE
jgi:hypothetical protein